MFIRPDSSGVEVSIEFDGALRYTFETVVLPGVAWERLLLEHRSAHDGFDYDPETFPPALLAASITGWTVHDLDLAADVEQSHIAPTIDEATELWNEWPQWARRRLLSAIELQNVTGRTLGKARRGRSDGHAPAAPTTD